MAQGPPPKATAKDIFTLEEVRQRWGKFELDELRPASPLQKEVKKRWEKLGLDDKENIEIISYRLVPAARRFSADLLDTKKLFEICRTTY